MQDFKVALIQLHPEYCGRNIRAAAAKGAHLAVLPEYHLSGWAPEDQRFLTIAQSGRQYIQRYQALATELSISIVPGTILVAERYSESTGSRPSILNIACFIDDKGRILGEYTKTNLWHPEREHLTSAPTAHKLAGNDACSASHHNVIDTSFGKVGLLICYDLAFPEAFRSLIRAGARLIVIPTFTKADDMSPKARAYNPDGEVLFLQSALISRAFENTCCIIFCNAGGEASEGYVGRSQVVMPIIGKLPGSHDSSQAGLRVVSVDMKVVDVAEENYKIRQDLAEVDFHYQ